MRMLLPPYILHHIALIAYLILEERVRDSKYNEQNLFTIATDPETMIQIQEEKKK